MGGLAAAIAGAHAGWQPRLFEQASAFSEAGAGIQLGPNATRVLHVWGLAPALAQAAAFPDRLRVRSAATGAELAQMALGNSIAHRYGAPYATLHRADLHSMLCDRAAAVGAELTLSAPVDAVHDTGDAVGVTTGGKSRTEGAALVGADGLWSAVRQQVWGDGPPRTTGHLAYRALLARQNLPAAVHSGDVSVWLGRRLHVVAYPVRQGDFLNVVAIVEGAAGGFAQDWNQAGAAADLQRALGPTCAALQELVQAATDWRVWTLHERPPVSGAGAMARGRVALLGDAAHPMRPYLAQGAGIAIEDAQALGNCLAQQGAADVPAALRRYAQERWERCARVQRRAIRNGRIFHAAGPLRWGRDMALRLLGERLLDMPWLYR